MVPTRRTVIGVLLYIDPLAFVLERDQALAAERDLIPCWFREEMDQGIDPLVTEVIQDQFERPGIVIEKNRLVTFDCYGVPLKSCRKNALWAVRVATLV
jgi:hypothetical protein